MSTFVDSKVALLNTEFSHQVLEYCIHHRGEPHVDDGQTDFPLHSIELSEWDARFISVGQEMLFDIILAAHNLDIRALLYVSRTALYTF